MAAPNTDGTRPGENSAYVTKHSAYIADRGGSRRVGELVKLSRVRWNRIRDDKSEASCLIQGSACSNQSELLSQIEPKRSELVIYRGRDRVWEGPVSQVHWGPTQVEVSAKDASDYLDGRPLSVEWSNAGVLATEVTTRIGDIISYEMANPYSFTPGGSESGQAPVNVPAWEQLDPPANVLPFLQVHHWPYEARTAATTSPFQMSVWEHLDNLARYSGIDYTVVGRAIHIWDTSRPLGQGRMLTESDFYGPIDVVALGGDFAALGFAVSVDGVFGGAGEPDPYYGPWAKIYPVYDENSDGESSESELASQASRNISGRNPVPVVVRVPENSSIRLNKDLTVNDLVPGSYFPLLATLNARSISQMQKLHEVVVEETSLKEDVRVTFVPASQSDEEVGE